MLLAGSHTFSDFCATRRYYELLKHREAAERLRQAEEFIENVKSPTTASELAKLCPADLRSFTFLSTGLTPLSYSLLRNLKTRL